LFVPLFAPLAAPLLLGYDAPRDRAVRSQQST